MENYPIYELKLKPLSPWITDLTADTIFGHLCWQIKYTNNNDVLERFLEEMAKKPIFTISDVLPADRLPRPLTEWDGDIDKSDTTIEDQKISLKKSKDYNKKIQYIDESNLNNFSSIDMEKLFEIRKNEMYLNSNNKYDNYFGFDLENKNKIDRHAWITLEKGIYSQSQNYFKENENNKVVRILLKNISWQDLDKYNIDWIEINFFEMIEKVFENWFGKKKSTWKGFFKIWKWIEKVFSNTTNWKHILLLSVFSPSEKDSTKWSYKIFTKFPKMWEEFSMKWTNFYKRPLIMIKEGAVFRLGKQYSWYVWRMIEEIAIDKKWIYHYGYGFTLEF